MKKILIALAFVLPLFIYNSVKAQNSPPNFDADVTVTSQYTCPSTGEMTGYIEVIGYAYKEYDHGTGYYNLLWNGNFPGYQPCTVEVTTDTDSYGKYCHGETTRDVSLYDDDITVELFPASTPPGGGSGQQ